MSKSELKKVLMALGINHTNVMGFLEFKTTIENLQPDNVEVIRKKCLARHFAHHF